MLVSDQPHNATISGNRPQKDYQPAVFPLSPRRPRRETPKSIIRLVMLPRMKAVFLLLQEHLRRLWEGKLMNESKSESRRKQSIETYMIQRE